MPHFDFWVNGETEADLDTMGRSWVRLYYEYKKKRSVRNPKDILAVDLGELFYFSKPILPYLSSRIITSFWKIQHKDCMNSYKYNA